MSRGESICTNACTHSQLIEATALTSVTPLHLLQPSPPPSIAVRHSGWKQTLPFIAFICHIFLWWCKTKKTNIHALIVPQMPKTCGYNKDSINMCSYLAGKKSICFVLEELAFTAGACVVLILHTPCILHKRSSPEDPGVTTKLSPLTQIFPRISWVYLCKHGQPGRHFWGLILHVNSQDA